MNDFPKEKTPLWCIGEYTNIGWCGISRLEKGVRYLEGGDFIRKIQIIEKDSDSYMYKHKLRVTNDVFFVGYPHNLYISVNLDSLVTVFIRLQKEFYNKTIASFKTRSIVSHHTRKHLKINYNIVKNTLLRYTDEKY